MTIFEIAKAQFENAGLAIFHEAVCPSCAPVAERIAALRSGPQHLGLGRFSVEETEAMRLGEVIANHEARAWDAWSAELARRAEAFDAEMRAKGFVLAWDEIEREDVYVKRENLDAWYAKQAAIAVEAAAAAFA